jgi:hypothetical protein
MIQVFNKSRFKVCDWLEFYPDSEEAIPHNVPEEKGHGVLTSCFVDLDHAGCKASQRHLVQNFVP